jgi:hypothetical protein
MDQATSASYEEKINGFTTFLSKAIISMNKEREKVVALKQAVDLSHLHYKNVYSNFAKFEHTAMDYFFEGKQEARIMTNPGEVGLEDEIKNEINTLKNPWAETLIWLKGELLDA